MERGDALVEREKCGYTSAQSDTICNRRPTPCPLQLPNTAHDEVLPLLCYYQDKSHTFSTDIQKILL